MIVDTNALSAWRDGKADLLKLIARADLLALPVIVIGEFRYGAARSRQRADVEEWLDRIIAATRVLPVTTSTAGHYSEIRSTLQQKGRPIPANDLWIAALAVQHDLPVLSRDRHFDLVDGLNRVSW